MFSEKRLKSNLPVKGLGEPLHFYKKVASTNDRAQALAQEGAAHGTLVIADEQTAGRGRFQRSWSTPPGSALALSLILRPEDIAPVELARLNMLGALAVVESLGGLGLDARIKWPNDVIISGGKVAGVLTESTWIGEDLEHAVLGIGVNVSPKSVPDRRDVDYPAACVEGGFEGKVNRVELLVEIVGRIGSWINMLASEQIHSAFEDVLAYRDQPVNISGSEMELTGVLRGLTPNCRLRIALAAGEIIILGGEDMQIRPVDMNWDWATLT
ncbi:MAG: biotin--[acetyl-CoA-carboxylase] ligase [Anaerolineales bacterium]|nr:biotin--[acetyl-CoA-carboxylase] ligase [Anaerolineales bacterium]MCK5633739.1 biotin--[acetyl-CoA-carboxylase] ligase [Anaerolineales bacterium]